MNTISKPKLISESKALALKIIEAERKGIQLGYRTRYEKINTAMLKWWRPGVTLIAGLSSVGKSTLVNNIIKDFTDQKLNPNAQKRAKPIVFNYETPSHLEVIRTVSNKTEKSFANLLSSELDVDSGMYNRISDEEFEAIKQAFNELDDTGIMYVDKPCTISEMEKICASEYNVNEQLVIAIDHILLTRKDHETSDDEIIQNIAFFAHDMYRKYNAIVILIHLLNYDIMQIERLLNHNFHYPVMKDVYRGAQIYWACDDVFILHSPEMIQIAKYGPKKMDTRRLHDLSKIKSRFGMVGHIWLENRLQYGGFRELNPTEVKSRQGVKAKTT
jgi:replicative DNA helicase